MMIFLNDVENNSFTGFPYADMYKYKVNMETYETEFFIQVWADNKAKATYKAYTMWKGKELSEKCMFRDFIKLFYKKTVLIND